ncbi:hypothetical protein DPMN_167081 [Dreissena polymorpha]|uniref:Uncharacterized protein n=1 Tax=Dreissena polymorpha TaxID=45954 RepID=A0A9D4IY81_DREPO|nr:hypothetical protein DPMN_167081 [Dreissena polymorpha]
MGFPPAIMSEACWSTVAQIILANQNTDLESGERIGYTPEANVQNIALAGALPSLLRCHYRRWQWAGTIALDAAIRIINNILASGNTNKNLVKTLEKFINIRYVVNNRQQRNGSRATATSIKRTASSWGRSAAFTATPAARDTEQGSNARLFCIRLSSGGNFLLSDRNGCCVPSYASDTCEEMQMMYNLWKHPFLPIAPARLLQRKRVHLVPSELSRTTWQQENGYYNFPSDFVCIVSKGSGAPSCFKILNQFKSKSMSRSIRGKGDTGQGRYGCVDCYEARAIQLYTNVMVVVIVVTVVVMVIVVLVMVLIVVMLVMMVKVTVVV